MAACYAVGLSRADLSEMTMGGIVDFFVEYNKLHDPKKEKEQNRTRIANQSDFDAF